MVKIMWFERLNFEPIAVMVIIYQKECVRRQMAVRMIVLSMKNMTRPISYHFMVTLP
jgi:hypothetical protein